MRPKRRTGRIVVVGAGINGLVAANYLQRGGYQVTLVERKPKVGGACTSATLRYRGAKVEYPTGASVLGMMQNRVFRETGLKERLAIFTPDSPEMLYFPGAPPFAIPGDPHQLARQAKRRWGERGRVVEFLTHLDAVAAFLRAGFRAARTPTVAAAQLELGDELTRLWITGSARDLLDHYLTSDQLKIYFAMSVTESGPVSLDAPYSAFTVPLMSSGEVFDAKWGFVKGGIWKLTEALGRINRALGVRIVTSARVTAVSAANRTVRYAGPAGSLEIKADRIVFATDPLTAAQALRDRALAARIRAQDLAGTSGKLILIFRRPVRFHDDDGSADFHAAFRQILLHDTLAGFERATRATRGAIDFAPGFLELYCEGPAMERMGVKARFHIISVFFKNLGAAARGTQLAAVKRQATELVCAHIRNPEDLVRSVLLTPRDLKRLFYFPGGNIDHVELTGGQTFAARTYASDPARSFYQFGDHEGVYYCGAGAYPCGSVAGTAGYMCAQQILARGLAR